MISPDRRTIIQILGSLMSNPNYLSDVDKYQLEPSDFPQQLDKFIFTAIYNLYVGGAELIHTVDIENYLQSNELAKNLLKKENGIAFLQDCETYCEPSNFSYYYNKLKKINLVRELAKAGHDVSSIYSTDPLNSDHTKINEKFESLTTEDIVNKLKGEIATLENKYVLNSVVEESMAFDGIKELVKELKDKPEIGIQLQGEIFNTITRGGRKGKLYLRSAASGCSKSRSSVGDACNIAYPIRYEPKYGKWVATGSCEKVLYVMTEQDTAEIQTMILAYLTGYNEEIFLYGTYGEEHMERIEKAVSIMEKYKDNMLFARIPDPCASVVKNLFRRYALQRGVENFFYDYIFSSPAMLEEYRDLKLPEHVCLRLFTTALKNLAVELNVFIMTATQISEQEEDKKSSWKDYHNIRGAKSIVDLCDFACIMSRPLKSELNEVASFQKIFNFSPNFVTNVFKNRRGRWNMVRIWSMKDLGTCRTYDLFITTVNNKPIEDFQIVDFVNEDDGANKELEDFYNEGIVSDNIYEELTFDTASNENSIDLLNVVKEAYSDTYDMKKRLENVEIGDLI